MKFKFWKLLPALLIFFVLLPQSFAKVEWNLLKKLNFDATPLDVAISPDGRLIFVLIDDGKILIYTADGTLKGNIDVGNPIDRIKIGPKGERLFITSRKNKAVEIIKLDFIESINISGSPFKGPQNAPIVLAEFSDFE